MFSVAFFPPLLLSSFFLTLKSELNVHPRFPETTLIKYTQRHIWKRPGTASLRLVVTGKSLAPSPVLHVERSASLRYKFTAVKVRDKQWCRGWAEINHKIRKRWGEVKRERGRGEDEEARSWEPYTYLLKWGIRVEEVEFPTEWGRGGLLQQGSRTYHLYLSKLIPRQAIQENTHAMFHLGIPKMHITYIQAKCTHTGIHTHLLPLLLLLHTRTHSHTAKSCPLALCTKLVQT